MNPRLPLSALPTNRPVGAAELGRGYGWGLEFFATPQLRTPLRVLLHHGERFSGPGAPPEYAREAWEGCWNPYVPTWKELGSDVDAPEFTSSMASDIGSIPCDGECHAFLTRVRQIVEATVPVEERRLMLRDELRRPISVDYCKKHGGTQNLLDLFFPLFLHSIEGLHGVAIDELQAQELKTPARLAAPSDLQLLAVKGIGPARLRAIRAACQAAVYLDAERVENVRQ